MAQTTLATLNTVNVNGLLSYELLSVGESVVLLGRWQWGAASADSSASLDGIAAFEYPDNATERQKRDVEKANGLLLLQPRQVFDSFIGARDITLFLYKEQSRLNGKGYRGEAAIEAIAKTAESAVKELEKLTGTAYAAKQRGDDLRAFITSEFPKTGESEFQEVIFDAAIIARTGVVTEVERSQFGNGMIPARFNDARLIQALYRTPAAMHGIDAETMTKIQNAYAAGAWPRTYGAVSMLAEMVESARQALASALVTVARVTSRPTDEPFAALTRGDWLREVRNVTLGISKREDDRRQFADDMAARSA